MVISTHYTLSNERKMRFVSLCNKKKKIENDEEI